MLSEASGIHERHQGDRPDTRGGVRLPRVREGGEPRTGGCQLVGVEGASKRMARDNQSDQ